MALTTLVKAASVLAIIQQVSGACYRPNGEDRNAPSWVKDNDYQPCNKGGGHSMCCSTEFSDTCLPNGLCYNAGAKLLWRESCTDPTWKDPACIKLCAGADQLSEEGKSMASIDSVITICGDNSLCCGAGAFAQRCCDAKAGFKLLSDGTVVKAYPDPNPTTAAPKPITAAPKNDPVPNPTPRPADPSPNTGSGGSGSGGGSSGGGGGNNNNGGGNSGGGGSDGGGSTNNGGGSGGSNSGGSGDSGGSGGNDNSNDNGNGGSGSPALSAGGADSTADPKSDGDGTTGNGGGKSNSTPNGSENGSENNNSDNDGSSTGKGTGNKDSKGAATSTDQTDDNASPGGSSSGDNRPGSSNDNSAGGSGAAPSGGSGSSGAVIGGVVGGVLGGLILFAIAAWFMVRRRRAMNGGYAAKRLDSASELPGTDGRTFYEVPGDHKLPAAPVVEQVVYVQDKPNEPREFHEMAARSPVLAAPTRYA